MFILLSIWWFNSRFLCRGQYRMVNWENYNYRFRYVIHIYIYYILSRKRLAIDRDRLIDIGGCLIRIIYIKRASLLLMIIVVLWTTTKNVFAKKKKLFFLQKKIVFTVIVKVVFWKYFRSQTVTAKKKSRLFIPREKERKKIQVIEKKIFLIHAPEQFSQKYGQNRYFNRYQLIFTNYIESNHLKPYLDSLTEKKMNGDVRTVFFCQKLSHRWATSEIDVTSGKIVQFSPLPVKWRVIVTPLPVKWRHFRRHFITMIIFGLKSSLDEVGRLSNS